MKTTQVLTRNNADTRVCVNSTGISLTNLPAKVFARIVEKVIKIKTENIIEEWSDKPVESF